MMNEKKNLLNHIPNIFGKNNSGQYPKVFGCGVKNVKTPQVEKVTTLNMKINPQYIRKDGGR